MRKFYVTFDDPVRTIEKYKLVQSHKQYMRLLISETNKNVKFIPQLYYQEFTFGEKCNCKLQKKHAIDRIFLSSQSLTIYFVLFPILLF